MPEEISQEKAREYMQVAALVCMDVEILHDIAQTDKSMTAEQLVKQIASTYKHMKMNIDDAKGRQARYESCCLIFGAAAAGFVCSEPLHKGEQHGHGEV